MRFFIIVSVMTTLFLSYQGQLFDDPHQYYKPMKFDAENRGSFNLSDCVKELMNCFELLEPDMICDSRSALQDTVCATLRNLCHDAYGNYDSDNNFRQFAVFLESCSPGGYYEKHWT